jgi:DNA-binding transcriptional regulator YiaG
MRAESLASNRDGRRVVGEAVQEGVQARLHSSRMGRPAKAAFAALVHDLRRRFGGKQAWLACMVGCTDAAVSFWETGKRIPTGPLLSRVIDALAQAGASPGELARLEKTWIEARLGRKWTI